MAGDAADEPGAKHQTVTYQYLNGIKDYVDYLVKVRKATPVEEDVISFEAEDLKLGISAELAYAVDHYLLRGRTHLREHDLLTTEGRYPRGGLPAPR